MESLLLTVLGLGLAVALASPLAVVTVIMLLSASSGLGRALAFVAGWLAAVAVIGAVSVLLLQDEDFGRQTTTPSRAASALELVLGVVALVWGLVAYRRRRDAPRSATAPGWLDRLDEMHWAFAFGLGAFLLIYALTLAAAAEILQADVSRVDGAIAFAVFAAASISTILAPVVVAVAAPARAAETLGRWRLWVLENSRSAGLVVLMLAGAAVAIKGVLGLVA